MASPALSSTPRDEQLEQLQRDLSSAHVRNRTLLKALTRAAAAPTVVAVLPGPHKEFDRVVILSNGITLERHWSPEEGWRYVQASTIPGTLAEIVDSVFAALAPDPAHVGGMAVVG